MLACRLQTNGMKPTIIEDSESDEDAIVNVNNDNDDNENDDTGSVMALPGPDLKKVIYLIIIYL